MAVVACSTPKKAEPEKTLAQQLEERLDSLRQKGYMAGHQDDPFYGIGWAYEDGKSDVKLTVGDYPAVMGFELGGIEMADEKNLDSVPFTRIHDELLAHVMAVTASLGATRHVIDIERAQDIKRQFLTVIHGRQVAVGVMVAVQADDAAVIDPCMTMVVNHLRFSGFIHVLMT